MPTVRLGGTRLKLYTGKVLQKKGWVTVSESKLYISRDRSRSYWTKALPKAKRPKVTFNDSTKTFRVATNRVVVSSRAQYNKVKGLLTPWIR